VDYARSRGVTLVASMGNGFTDVGNPEFDDSSPDYPPGAAYPRLLPVLQGTSMSSPHAAGVAALIVSEYGHTDHRRKGRKHFGGLTLHPRRIERILLRTATEHACPRPRLQIYPELPIEDTSPYNARCEGSRSTTGSTGTAS
jgi:hypothetical protein